MANDENVSLVKREVLPHDFYTEEAPQPPFQASYQDSLPPQEMDYIDADVSILSQFHEDALCQAGFGLFQWILFFFVGLGLAADAVELFVVAYVIPSAERELCMDDNAKGWLGGITFAGMMIGAVVWGSLSDRIGRRRTLITSLTVNALFAVIAAFMPNYGLFLTCRLLSGIGIGGSLPVVFSYFSEFLQKSHRGSHLSWLLMFWAVGGIFVALMAWAIIPRTGLNLMLLQVHFGSWRVFLLICSIPAFLALFGLIFLPESPRFLLEVGREVEAMLVYQKIYKWNHITQPDVKYQLSEMELPSRTVKSNATSPDNNVVCGEVVLDPKDFGNSFFQLFFAPHTKTTFVLLILWFTTAFGYYGLSIWFPEYIKLMEIDNYSKEAKIFSSKTFVSLTFNSTIENFHYINCTFTNVLFKDLILNHITFDNCDFFDCLFDNIQSSKSFFKDSYFTKTIFSDTDFYEYRFVNCIQENSTFHNLKPGCKLDFDINFQLSTIFFENLIGQLAIVPGNIVSAFIMDRLGRVKIIGMSLFLSAVSAFFIWFLNSRASVIALEGIFNCLVILAWNAIDIATTEAYPTNLRSTGYGFLSAFSRIGGILGNVAFGSFIGTSKAIPMLTTAAALLVGGLASVKLPETKDVLI